MKNVYQKEHVGQICHQAIHHKEAPCDFCTNEIILTNKGAPYQWEHFNPVLEKHLLVTDRIIKWPDGRDGRFEFAVDITRQKKAEQDLEKSQDSSWPWMRHKTGFGT